LTVFFDAEEEKTVVPVIKKSPLSSLKYPFLHLLFYNMRRRIRAETSYVVFDIIFSIDYLDESHP
jgi:hypothetical protein